MHLIPKMFFVCLCSPTGSGEEHAYGKGSGTCSDHRDQEASGLAR